MAPKRMTVSAPPVLPEARRWGRAGVCSSAVTLAAIAFAFPSAVAIAAEDWVFTPRASVGLIWTDNVNFLPEGLEESDWILEVTPGFSLTTDRPRLNFQFDYDLQALWFADDSDINDIYHQAVGTGALVLVPQSLFLEAFTRYDQQSIDPRGRIDFSNLAATGNRTNAFVYGVSPYHTGRWGGWSESLVRYQYQAVHYTETDVETLDLEDSNTQSVFASLASLESRPGMSWRAAGSLSVTDFEEADDFEFARVLLDIGVPVGRVTRATASAGRESDVEENPSGGGLDAPFWFLGFEWEPSSLHRLYARGGQRYYGTAWEAHWTRHGSRGELGLDYTEGPTTQSGLISGADFDVGFQPGGVAAIDTRVFLLKNLTGRATYNLARSTVVAQIYHSRYFYDDTDSVERQYGGALNLEWRMAVRSRLGVDLAWRRFDDGNEEYTATDFGVRFTRELTSTMSGSLAAAHLRRHGDNEDNEYRVNRIFLYLTAQF